jgi:integrase
LTWRAGLRISEALSLAESDLDQAERSVLIRHGENGKRREVGMDPWGWQHLETWRAIRVQMRVGALLCVIDGPTQGRPWSATAARATLGGLAVDAGVRRRFAPHH